MKQSKQNLKATSKQRNVKQKEEEAQIIPTIKSINQSLSQKRVSTHNSQQDKTPLKSKQISKQKQPHQLLQNYEKDNVDKPINKQNSTQKLFEGLTFMIEVYENDTSMAKLITPRILSNGGMTTDSITGQTSYLVYENGREQLLKKVLNEPAYRNVKVIAPFWIQQSIVANKLLDYSDFQPIELEKMIQNVIHISPIQKKNLSPENNIFMSLNKNNSGNSSRSKRSTNQVRKASVAQFIVIEDEEGVKGDLIQDSKRSTKNKKKRNSPSITQDEDQRMIEQIVPKSKRKAKEISKTNQVSFMKEHEEQSPKTKNVTKKNLKQQTLNMPPLPSRSSRTLQNIDQSFNMEKEEIDKTFQQIKEEQYFKKEFEREIKRFNKMAQSLQKDNFILNKQQNPDESILDVSFNANQQLFQDQNGNEQINTSIISNQQHRQKREVKYLTKNQLIDSYIEGDIELVDFIDNMVPKLNNNKKKQGHNGGQHKRTDHSSNRRISEMYQRKNNNIDRPMIDEDQNSHLLDISQDQSMIAGHEEHKQMNRSAMVSLSDYLFDIDKENTPLVQFNKCKPESQSTLKQSNLFSMGLMQQRDKLAQSQQIIQNKENISLFNCKPLSIFSGLSNQRITKSYTMAQNALQTIQESPKFNNQNQSPQQKRVLEYNDNYKRAKSFTPLFRYSQDENFSNAQYSYQNQRALTKQRDANETSRRLQYLHMNEDDELNELNITFKNKQRGRKGQQQLQQRDTTKNRQKKEWSKLLPKRNMPSRGCKMNVSYVEEDEDEQRQQFKRRMLFNR